MSEELDFSVYSLLRAYRDGLSYSTGDKTYAALSTVDVIELLQKDWKMVQPWNGKELSPTTIS